MPKKTLHHPDLAEDLNLFLEELCERWDFCAGVKGADLLKDKKRPLTSKVFTDTVILAEGAMRSVRRAGCFNGYFS